MANELQLQTEPIQADLSAGAVIRNAAGQVWNPANSAFEVFVDASIGTYAITMAEQGTTSGYYIGDFPAGITQAGTYTVVVYDLDDTTDIIGAGEVTWHGSASSAVAGSGQTYGVTAAFSVPNAQTGQAGNLSGQFYGADGVAVGDPVNATFIEKGSTGCYGLTCASPGSGSYFLVLSLSGTVLPGPALPVAPPPTTTSINITPTIANVTNPRYSTRDLPPIGQGSAPTEVFTIVDASGAAIDLSGKILRCVAYILTDVSNIDSIYDDTATGEFKYETGGDGITIGGASNNQVTLQHDAIKTATAGKFYYVLWNVTDKLVLTKGLMPIEPMAFDVS